MLSGWNCTPSWGRVRWRTHDHAPFVVGVGGLDQRVGKILALDAERVVAVRFERPGDPLEDALPVVADGRGFAVDDVRGVADGGAVGCTERLVAETDPQCRVLELAKDRDGDARRLRGAGAGGHHDAIRVEFADPRDVDGVVAPHYDVATVGCADRLADVLDEVYANES